MLRHAVQRAGIDAAEVEDVVLGCAFPEGANGFNVGRISALAAGFPDLVARRYGIDRSRQDDYSARSQQRYAAAWAAGHLHAKIVPIRTTMSCKDKDGRVWQEDVTLARDEGARPGTTLQTLAALKPVNEGGSVTAGNASQLSDGAAACVLMDADLAARRRLPVLGWFRGFATAGCAPDEMVSRPSAAVARLRLSTHSRTSRVPIERPEPVTRVICNCNPWSPASASALGATASLLRRTGG